LDKFPDMTGKDHAAGGARAFQPEAVGVPCWKVTEAIMRGGRPGPCGKQGAGELEESSRRWGARTVSVMDAKSKNQSPEAEQAQLVG